MHPYQTPLTLFAIAIAGAALLGCGNKTVDAAPVKPARQGPPLQRLVGNVNIEEDFAMMHKGGKPFMTRKLALTGKFNQLVQVNEGADGTLNLRSEDGGPIRLTGAVDEQGASALDSPNDNIVVKSRGDSHWKAALDKVDLSIKRSALGAGDEIVLHFATPVSGKMTMHITDRSGTTTDHGNAGNDLFLSLMEDDPADPTRRVYKRDYRLLPSLGAEPADAFNRSVYEGLKANPEVSHLGLITSPDRRSWRYQGSTSGAKAGADTRMKEHITLELMLVKP